SSSRGKCMVALRSHCSEAGCCRFHFRSNGGHHDHHQICGRAQTGLTKSGGYRKQHRTIHGLGPKHVIGLAPWLRVLTQVTELHLCHFCHRFRALSMIGQVPLSLDWFASQMIGFGCVVALPRPDLRRVNYSVRRFRLAQECPTRRICSVICGWRCCGLSTAW
ncbi:MAG: hypothetical protein JWN34_5518, partial [Bryobacterales bacterium]|nr:hypothetical protein [Bryobacterales bacterium]